MKILKYRELVKILRRYDKQFEIYTRRGKGSERMIYHPSIGGKTKSYPIKCHNEGMDMKKGSQAAILRHFDLPKDLFD